MIPRAASGWQTILADLSLILFMITAAALARSSSGSPENGAPEQAPAEIGPSPLGEPLAIWRDAPGMPPLGQWIAEQAPDTRQQLTIFAQYRPGGQAAAAAHALELAEQAKQSGEVARIVVEPGPGEMTVELAFDVPASGLARELLRDTQSQAATKDAP